jgi:hypothetical protein
MLLEYYANEIANLAKKYPGCEVFMSSDEEGNSLHHVELVDCGVGTLTLPNRPKRPSNRIVRGIIFYPSGEPWVQLE